MHFQPMENIAENLEESGSRHPNIALFNRLLNVAPSPPGFMGGALRRTSAQLQRLRHSPGIDQCTSDDEDDESCKVGKGGSLPSGLGQDTQSTVCSFREEKSVRAPLLEVYFGADQETRGGRPATDDETELSQGEGETEREWQTGEEKGKAESSRGETQAAPLPPPPWSVRETSARPSSAIAITSHHPSAFLFHPDTPLHSSLEHCCSQPAINQSRDASATLKPPFGRNKMSLLTVRNEPQRVRSVSIGSELTGSQVEGI